MQSLRGWVPLSSILKLSIGWCGLNTMQTEKTREAQAQMHLLTTSYIPGHEWGPHTDIPYCYQMLKAKTFRNASTQCKENVVLHFSSCKTFKEDKVRERESERLLFSEMGNVILPSVLHVVLFYHVCKIINCTTGFTFVFVTAVILLINNQKRIVLFVHRDAYCQYFGYV